MGEGVEKRAALRSRWCRTTARKARHLSNFVEKLGRLLLLLLLVVVKEAEVVVLGEKQHASTAK